MESPVPYDSLWPMPGGVTRYFDTALQLLKFVADERPTPDAFFQYLAAHYNVTGRTAAGHYAGTLRRFGWTQRDGACVVLTRRGAEILATRDPERAFTDIAARTRGLLESLEILQLDAPPVGALRDRLNALLGTGWVHTAQARSRVNWLRSLGRLPDSIRFTGDGPTERVVTRTAADGTAQGPVTAHEVHAAFARLHPNPQVRAACVGFFADGVMCADAQGAARWSAKLRRGARVRLYAGALCAIEISPDAVWLALDDATLGDDGLALIARIGSPGPAVKTLEGLSGVTLSPPVLATHVMVLRDAFLTAVRRGAAAVRERTPFFRSATSPVIAAAEDVVGHALPRPAYGEPRPVDAELPYDQDALTAAFAAFRQAPPYADPPSDKAPIDHPESRAALAAMGLAVDDPSGFAEVTEGLRADLGARDIREVDCFLRAIAAGLLTEFFPAQDDAAIAHDGAPEHLLLDAETADPTSLDAVHARLTERGMRIDRRTLRRYRAAIETRRFVILAGASGTGKTWLAQLYAEAVGAECCVIAVAPNWSAGEDLLGFSHPISGRYVDTPFSTFLRAAALAHAGRGAPGTDRPARAYHVVLDEMNLARVEHYFARFLSAMELCLRDGEAGLALAPGDVVTLPPNLYFVGTVNMDETTHGFADKVFDRAQLIELPLDRGLLEAHVRGTEHGPMLLRVWDAVHDVAPFAFRVLDDVARYVEKSRALGASWEEALDEQVLQKVLPRLKGADPRVERALSALRDLCAGTMPLARRRAEAMLEAYRAHGFASFF